MQSFGIFIYCTKTQKKSPFWKKLVFPQCPYFQELPSNGFCKSWGSQKNFFKKKIQKKVEKIWLAKPSTFES